MYNYVGAMLIAASYIMNLHIVTNFNNFINMCSFIESKRQVPKNYMVKSLILIECIKTIKVRQ